MCPLNFYTKFAGENLLWNLQTNVASFSLSANSVSSNGTSTVGGRNTDLSECGFGRTEKYQKYRDRSSCLFV